MPRNSLRLLVCPLLFYTLLTTPPTLVYALDAADPATNIPPEWQTKAEITAFSETARYDSTIVFCKRLAQASPLLEYQVAGTSPQGRDIPILILAGNGEFTPTQATDAAKTVVFINNCIHAGEVAGKDATLMLLRDIAIAGRYRHLLKNVVLVAMPIFSVDGHERFSPHSRINQNGPREMGWRVTAHNLNLNRDFTKADAPEMRTWLRVFNAWMPDLHIDNHTTNGGDWQFDVALAMTAGPWVHTLIDQWVTNHFQPHLQTALEADGHMPSPYFAFLDRYDLSKGIRSGGAFSPRFSTGYCATRNRVSILVEAHAYKPYQTRVLATYHTMLHTLQYLSDHHDELPALVRRADRNTTTRFSTYDPQAQFPLTFRRTSASQPFLFRGYAQDHVLSDISGRLAVHYDRSRPINLEIPHFHTLDPDLTINPPLGYIIPGHFTEVLNLLSLHHILAYRLDAPLTTQCQVYRFHNLTYPPSSFEGRHLPNSDPKMTDETLTFDPHSIYVPVGQPVGHLVMHLLEPHAPDSLFAWGFFNAFLEHKEYAEPDVLEQLARSMLQDDPQLKTEFQHRIATDPDFRSNPRERLHFFYRRSPYWDHLSHRYPIARVLTSPDVAMTPLTHAPHHNPDS